MGIFGDLSKKSVKLYKKGLDNWKEMLYNKYINKR